MRNQKKLIVWDLFGGGQNSVFNSLKQNKLLNYFNVLTFDITPATRSTHYKLDLSSDDVIEQLKSFPRPDIIVSSPLCQSFSSILTMKGGGTCFWKYADETKTALKERSIDEFEQLKSGFTRYLKADDQLFIKRLGEKCILNTLKIIDYFKPKFWYIENPKNSLMWKFIKYNTDFLENKQHYFNKTYYSNYGYLTKKPTIFLSNIFLNLLNNSSYTPHYEIKIIDGKKYCYFPKIDKLILYNFKDIVKYSCKSINHEYVAPKSNTAQTTAQTRETGTISKIPNPLIVAIFKEFLNVY